jgi:gas vesicle protein
MKDSTKVLGALVLGAAAGAVLGLLFAPDKGSEIRKKLKDNAEDLLDELADKIEEGKTTLTDLKEKIMSNGDNIVKNASNIVESELDLNQNGQSSGRSKNPVKI